MTTQRKFFVMSASANAMTQRSPSITRHKLVQYGLIGLTALIGLIVIATIWIWMNRYALIERQAITYLNSLGIDADLDIQSASRTEADIRNIRLSYDGEAFLTIQHLQAAYQWRDLLNGQVERLDFEGLNAIITVDETGAIIDGWQPPSTGNNASGFPLDGITAKDARLTLHTPYGTGRIEGNAEIASPTQFSFQGNIQPTELTQDEISLSLEGPVSLKREDGPFQIATNGLLLSVSHTSATVKQTRLDLLATYDPKSQSGSGNVELRGGDFDSAARLTGNIETISIEGRGASGEFAGTIRLDLSETSLDDVERRRKLVETLSLTRTLADVPVAQNFAPTLQPALTDLLSGSDINANLSVTLSDDNRDISLRSPMHIDGENTRAILTPVQDIPFYVFDPQVGHYDITSHVSLSHPLAIGLDALHTRITSENGASVDGLQFATGILKTKDIWSAQTLDGRPARLAPLSVAFDYQGRTNETPQLSLVGGAHYDGDIPGGYVTGLKAGGVLTARLGIEGTRVAFDPNSHIRLDHLETSSEWRIQDFTGRLTPTQNLYQRTPNQASGIGAVLNDLKFTAYRPAGEEVDAADIHLTLDRAMLSGQLARGQQDWDIAFDVLRLGSQTFPLPQTHLTLPTGEMTIRLSSDQRTHFRVTAPSSTLNTELFTARETHVYAEGTAENYHLTYQDGRVRIHPQSEDGLSLPVVPISGDLIFVDGAFTGDATTSLPQAPETPIQVQYRFEDGLGAAEVIIDRLTFRPDGLQPQDLSPTLRGKIAQVEGPIDAHLSMSFGGDSPVSGTGTVTLDNLSLGTAPGPVTGLSGTVELTSLFPVLTAPDQQLRVGSFNPGYSLEDGELTYTLVTDGVSIASAIFPLGDGSVSFDPFLWTYGAQENRVILRVSGVEVGEFLEDTADGRLQISGLLEGTIPVVVRGIDVLVEEGRLEVKDGGVIQYQGGDIADALPNEHASHAIEALRNFTYDELFLNIDGPLDGEVTLGMAFTGSNPDVLYDVPFQFDVAVKGELFNIARSFNPNALQQRALSVISGDED